MPWARPPPPFFLNAVSTISPSMHYTPSVCPSNHRYLLSLGESLELFLPNWQQSVFRCCGVFVLLLRDDTVPRQLKRWWGEMSGGRRERLVTFSCSAHILLLMMLFGCLNNNAFRWLSPVFAVVHRKHQCRDNLLLDASCIFHSCLMLHFTSSLQYSSLRDIFLLSKKWPCLL